MLQHTKYTFQRVSHIPKVQLMATSDFHNLVCTSTKFHVKQRKSTNFNYRSYKKFNVDSFTDDLSSIPYHIAINVRKMLKRKYDRCKNTVNWNNIEIIGILSTKLRKKSMNNYIQSKCSNTRGNGKDFWDTVKPLISHKSFSKNDKTLS